MICSKCGLEVQGGKFCSECGAPISQEKIEQSEKVEIDPTVRLGADKYYKKDEKAIAAALAHRVFSDPQKVIMYAGNYYANLDSYFMFINTDEVVLCKINEKKPETDVISFLNYSDPRLDDFYDSKRFKLNFKEEDIGFKPGKIQAYAENWNVILNEVKRLRGQEYSVIEPKKGFWQRTIEEGREINRQKEAAKIAHPKPISKKDRIKENKANGVACCPKCGSTSLSANKKGFGVGKAAVGVFTVGVLGAAAGGIGSGKVVVTCLNCGHRWKV